MSVTSGNWTNGSLGPQHWLSMASATESPWTPFSFLQIPAPLLGVIGPILGLKIFETGSNPLKLLHVMSPEAVTENPGQGILTGFLGPSELKRLEDAWRILLATKCQHCQQILSGVGQVTSTCIYSWSFSFVPCPLSN